MLMASSQKMITYLSECSPRENEENLVEVDILGGEIGGGGGGGA